MMAMDLRDATRRSEALVVDLRGTFQQISRIPKEPTLAGEVHEALKQHEDGLELLQQDVEDLTLVPDRSHGRDTERARESARLAAQVARLSEDIKHARNQYRRAQSASKRALEASRQAEREASFTALKKAYAADKPAGTREDLFAGRRTQKKALTEDELLMNTSSDVTAALRQTHDRLSSELSRSRFAQETLAQSTAALSDLGEKYSNLDTLLANSKTLLGTLVRSQKSDTWYLETAFWILVGTLGWLVFRRFIYGPGWWLVYMPLKLFIWQPLAFLLKSAGGSPDGVEALQSASTTSRRPLRIHPSATGGGVRLPPDVERGNMHRVGLGGTGAKVGQLGERRGEAEGMADKIGRMAERSRQAAEGLPPQEGEEDAVEGGLVVDEPEIKQEWVRDEL